MSSVDWLPELASALERLLPPEDGSRADWGDVVGRVRGHRQSRPAHKRLAPLGRTRLVLVAVVLLLLAGTAMTMYYVLRGPAGLVVGGEGGFVQLDASGRARAIGRWQCPRRVFCGDVAGWAMSPDGERVALSSTEIGARSTYPGLHIVDLKTGADSRIPALPRYYLSASIPTLERVGREDRRRLGCAVPIYLSWAPNGSRFAYTCPGQRFTERGIWTIRTDGSGRRLVPTHAVSAFSPTWSPNGKQLAFATGELGGHSSIYVVDLNGQHERRLATGAFPDWSPNGKTILYAAPGCGGLTWSSWRIRLVTPRGRDATPSQGGCRGIGPSGSLIAAWSPDGGRIAVETAKWLYVMSADGTGLERPRLRSYQRGVGLLFGGLLRPLWRHS
jgi:hypothetical protein